MLDSARDETEGDVEGRGRSGRWRLREDEGEREGGGIRRMGGRSNGDIFGVCEGVCWVCRVCVDASEDEAGGAAEFF